MQRFHGKHVLITGASGGLGRSIVRRFHEEGATVIVSDYNEFAIAETIAEIGGGARLIPLQLDVTSAEAVAAAFAHLDATTGPIDHLVNGAGVASISPITEISPEAWRRVHAVNLDGVFLMSKEFITRALDQKRKGSIVNIASIAGLMALDLRPAYISSKHAVVGLTRELAMDYSRHGIRINAIAPGTIRTPMTEGHFQDPDRAARIAGSHAIGRGGEPEEVAAPIAFLCSDDASYITGAILAVDGGYSAGKAW